MNATYILLAAAIAIWLLRPSKDSWRPFAWYGYKVGEYQPGGDWSCVVSPTTGRYRPSKLLPTTGFCDRVYHKRFPRATSNCKKTKK